MKPKATKVKNIKTFHSDSIFSAFEVTALHILIFVFAVVVFLTLKWYIMNSFCLCRVQKRDFVHPTHKLKHLIFSYFSFIRQTSLRSVLLECIFWSCSLFLKRGMYAFFLFLKVDLKSFQGNWIRLCIY